MDGDDDDVDDGHDDDDNIFCDRTTSVPIRKGAPERVARTTARLM